MNLPYVARFLSRRPGLKKGLVMNSKTKKTSQCIDKRSRHLLQRHSRLASRCGCTRGRADDAGERASMDAEEGGSGRVDPPDGGGEAEVSRRTCFRFRQKRAPVSVRTTNTFLFDLARSRTRALTSHRWETGSRRRTASSMLSHGRGVAEASYATRCWS